MKTLSQGELIWEPKDAGDNNLARYTKWLEEMRGLRFEDYPALWSWSVEEPGAFWSSIADYFQVKFRDWPQQALGEARMPGTEWFPGATLNYAEHALAQPDETEALLAATEDGSRRMTRRELAQQVAAAAAKFRSLGLKRGDRVAGYLCNTPEAVAAFLATASIGAIWSNCPAELSSRSVLDRFAQIEPRLFVTALSYRYGGKTHDRRAMAEEIAAGLPTVEHVIFVPDGKAEGLRCQAPVSSWADLPANPPALVFEALPFDHPLWILYSSGTTGIPKAIVQGHGGILLEHLKALALHLDLRAGDRFFWYTTSGWMMWNLLVSGLLLPGVTVTLYDGSPKHPSLDVLWKFVAEEKITVFGISAPFLLACLKENLAPAHDFSHLRELGSTGAPLPPEGFGWVRERVKKDLWIASISGGTDVCTAFALGHPGLPVRAGEMQCVGLGACLEVWDENQRPIFGRIGELVLAAPLPSMPVSFWNDPTGEKLRASYFERYPGAWCHGDWIEIAEPGLRCVIHGRSDATLNRGGVRMGTAELYSVVEAMPEIAEALALDTCGLGREDRLLLFVAVRPGTEWNEELKKRIAQRLRTEISPRHVPDEIHCVPEIPRTLNGKKLEVPIKRLLAGLPVERVVQPGSMANPGALDYFIRLAGSYTS